MVWPPGNPLVSTLNDEFNANNLDITKWYNRGGSQYPILLNDNGRVRLNGLRTVGYFDTWTFPGQSIYRTDISWQTGHLESQVTNYNVDGISASLEVPTNLWNSEVTYGGTPSYTATFRCSTTVGSPASGWGVSISLSQSSGEALPHGTLTSSYYYDNYGLHGETYGSRVDPYDYVAHRYIRLRSRMELNTGEYAEWFPYKTIFMVDVSADGVTWNGLLESLPQTAPYMEQGCYVFFYNSGGYLWLDHVKGWPATNLKVRLVNNTWRDIPLPLRRTSSNSWQVPPNLKVRLANNTWRSL